MSIADKQIMMHEIEKSLGSCMTADDLAKTMQTLSERLSVYEVQRVSTDGEDAESGEFLDTFLSAKRIEGRSEKTIARYEYIIKRMCKAVGTPIRQISVFHLRKYFSDEKARGVADSTLDGNRQVLSTFFGWLQKEGLITTNPTSNLGAIKCQKKIKVTYTEVDIEKLKFGCRTLRDRAIIAFLLSTGCRISEMTQLDRDDIDLNNLERTVLGKGNKERTVYLDPVTGMLIKAYLESRTDDFPALFIGKGSERLKPGGVRFMLNKVADRAQVEHVHPHKFRRTMATNLIRHGMPIQEVAAILGHDKLDTTMQYVVLDKSEVRNAYRKFA